MRLIIYLTLILVFILFYYLSRRRKTIGKLIVTEQTIEIETKNQSYEVKISDLNNFSVDSKYLRTRKEFASLAGSIDNWILFDFQNNKYNYQFAITSGYAGNKFRELIVDWSKNDNFKLINEK